MNRRERNKRKKLKAREKRIKANKHIRWRKGVEKKREEQEANKRFRSLTADGKELYFLERIAEDMQNEALRAAKRAEREKRNKKD